MKRIDWKTSAELIGIAAIVVSLYFLGAQLRVSQDLALSEIAAAHNAALIELNNGISEHADVWVRGNAGDELGRVEHAIYLGLLNGKGEYHRLEWRHNLRFNRGTDVLNDPTEFAVFLFNNSGARRVWVADKNAFYDSIRAVVPDYSLQQFYELVTAALEKLDQQQGQPLSSTQ